MLLNGAQNALHLLPTPQAPTDELPPTWSGAADIATSFPDIHGSFEASEPRRLAKLAERKRN